MLIYADYDHKNIKAQGRRSATCCAARAAVYRAPLRDLAMRLYIYILIIALSALTIINIVLFRRYKL